jgi:putative endonuclease
VNILPSRRSPHSAAVNPQPDIGVLAEDLVAQWLTQNGWNILHRRWRCRWGEIDLIAQTSANSSGDNVTPMLTFVEVKARSRGNWDADGLLAITPQKQGKVCQTARIFLSKYPHLANLPCRFDVALVNSQPTRNISISRATPSIDRPQTESDPTLSAPSLPPIHLGSSIVVAGYCLCLQQYLEGAFD